MSLRQHDPYPRRHGPILEPAARRRLERDGWRTTLDFREKHIRSRDGQLVQVEAHWTAEAERFDGGLTVASASAATPDEAWDALCAEIDAHRVRTTGRIRVITGSFRGSDAAR
mgnify:CR=1 FL=1